jgi:AcrR family transcriptional regulator
MPKRIIGVSERLLAVAKEEFIDKGFEGASIKEIASKADTSPRAIYTRFANKEDLFCRVVGNVVDEFNSRFRADKDEYFSGKTTESPADYYTRYLEYAYEHKEEFVLLLTKASGTRYEHFCKDLADTDMDRLKAVISAGNINVNNNINIDIVYLFIGQITYSFYDNLFVPLLKGYSLSEAKEYITTMVEFYMKGIEAFHKTG